MSWFSRKPSVPASVETFTKLYHDGLAAQRKGDWQQCHECMLKALDYTEAVSAAFVSTAFCFLGAAELAFHHKDHDPEHLKTAIGLLATARATGLIGGYDGNAQSIYFNMGECLLRQGKFHESEEQFLKYIELSPDVKAYLKLGFLCHKTQRRAEAIEYCKRALEIDPSNPDALYNLRGLLWQGLHTSGA
jgi:tetratricopeptide (TPR) repeat protein